MRLPLPLSILVLSLVACGAFPLFSNASLDGKWGWDMNRNPAGSSMNLSLATHGRSVTGSGQICGIGPRACSPGSVTVTGETLEGTFQFTLRGDSGFVATYTGQLVGQDELRGTWALTGQSNTVTFVRE